MKNGQYSLYGHFGKETCRIDMSRNLSIVEAKTHLSDCIREVEQGESVLITRHGRAVAALVPANIIEYVERLKKAGPEGGLASVAGGWKGSEDLVRILASSKRTKPRRNKAID
jgi:prevent-host-death family protein